MIYMFYWQILEDKEFSTTNTTSTEVDKDWKQTHFITRTSP